MQRLGMQHELSAFGRGGWRGNRHLAAELVRRPCLASADALHLGGVPSVDLWSALALLLMANPQCKIEQRTEAILPCRIGLDLAANIADDAAKSRAQEFELPPSALELVGCVSRTTVMAARLATRG